MAKRMPVLGVAYKKDVDDLRESPALKVMQLLREGCAQVDYNDPFFHGRARRFLIDALRGAG